MAIAITVKFLPGTNSNPARMRGYSPLTKALTVHYPAGNAFDASDLEACARYAAEQVLLRINGISQTYGETWALDQYIETYDGSRHFSLK